MHLALANRNIHPIRASRIRPGGLAQLEAASEFLCSPSSQPGAAFDAGWRLWSLTNTNPLGNVSGTGRSRRTGSAALLLLLPACRAPLCMRMDGYLELAQPVGVPGDLGHRFLRLLFEASLFPLFVFPPRAKRSHAGSGTHRIPHKPPASPA